MIFILKKFLMTLDSFFYTSQIDMLYRRPKQKITGELIFLNKFLESGYFDKFRSERYELTIIQEPFTEFGYADVVCVRWDKSISRKWSSKRNDLIKDDIKILHHLYNCRVYKRTDDIVNELGFSFHEIEKTITRLLDANLVMEAKNGSIRIRAIKEIFYVNEIIAIEAKLKDWKRALEQSLNNVSFSSKSFSLFPDKTINDRLVKSYSKYDIGVLSFDSSCREIVKPKRNKIPASLTSWYLNEYIGRELSCSC